MADDHGSVPLSADPYGDFLANAAKIQRSPVGRPVSDRELFAKLREKFGPSPIEIDPQPLGGGAIDASQRSEKVELLFDKNPDHDLPSQPVNLKQALARLVSLVLRHIRLSSNHNKEAS